MKYSFKKISIEAPFPTTQFGHTCQTFDVDTYNDHLYARTLGLKDEKNWLIHVSLDLLAFDLEHRNALQAKLRDHYNNQNLHLITSATHTHYSHSVVDPRYIDWLMNTLFEGIIAMEYEEKGHIYTTYNRMHTTSTGKSRITGYETNNEFLSVIRFFNETDNFFNLIINNCHPTTLSDENTKFFSAEYPGVSLKLLEDEYDSNFSFIQGACGDISSRFVRQGQTYEDMCKIAKDFAEDVKSLMELNGDKKLLTLDYSEQKVIYEHEFTPIDLSKIGNVSQRELEQAKEAQAMREALGGKGDQDSPLAKTAKRIFGNPIKEVIVAAWNLGSLKIVFYPNEIFSEYMNLLDMDKAMLVSYSNGYGPYILPIGFPYPTYERFLDTLTDKTKENIMEVIKNI